MSEATNETRLSLDAALRCYWRYLLGIALFPSLAFPAMSLFHVPFGFLVPPFIAVAWLAAWPYSRKRAPYAFWLVAMGVWLVAGGVGVLVLQLLRLILGSLAA